MAITIAPEIIKEISQYLEMGMHCFYHIPTGNIEYYPDEMQFSGDTDDEIWKAVKKKVKKHQLEYIGFEALDKHESFKLMESFVESIENDNIRERFEDAIRYKKPFQNFKQLLNNYMDLREQWFVHKDKAGSNNVQQQLEIYNRTKAHEIDGVE